MGYLFLVIVLCTWYCSQNCLCSVKVDQKAAASWLVLSSHLQLQKEGFLSTWTNSFVGPWDPSQGLHNPGKSYQHSCWIDASCFCPLMSVCLLIGRWKDQALAFSAWAFFDRCWEGSACCFQIKRYVFDVTHY